MKRQTPIAGGYHGSGDLTIVAYRASYAVVLEARQPVDRAGAMENGRVEEWRGGVQGRRRQARATPFVAALAEKPIAPFPLPAHRTGRDHLGHPALGRVSRAGIRNRQRDDASNENTPSSPNTRASGNCR
jgi:hypothetical protein